MFADLSGNGDAKKASREARTAFIRVYIRKTGQTDVKLLDQTCMHYSVDNRNARLST